MEALTLALAMGLIASCNAAPHDPIISLVKAPPTMYILSSLILNLSVSF